MLVVGDEINIFKGMLDSEKYIKIISDIAEQPELYEGLRIFVIVQDSPEHVKQEEAPEQTYI